MQDLKKIIIYMCVCICIYIYIYKYIFLHLMFSVLTPTQCLIYY